MAAMGWADAMEAARAIAPASTWRGELARELRTAVEGSLVAVMTCAPGDWTRISWDTDPPELGGLIERIHRDYIPRVERVGEDWRFALRTHGTVYAPIETARARKLADELRADVLRPAGIGGWLTVFFTTGDPPRLLGIAAVGADDDSGKLLGRAAAPLAEIARAASGTLAGALALAEGCFALPAAPGRLDELSARERQVAVLSAQGFANVNVAARLAISETTVAVHLRRIYAKLGVHSRVELAEALRNPA